jgi:alkylation response protein AidB-like acyl-CoA dehydrogenase
VEETPEQLLVRESVRKIAQASGTPFTSSRPAQAARQTSCGPSWAFIGVNLPEEFDGGGMGTAELAIVSEEISAAGPPRHCSVLGDG